MEGVRQEILAESARDDCFLCRPNAALLAAVGEDGYAVAGLGPLSDGYAVIATHDHLLGLAEADARLRTAYASYAQHVARVLAKNYGNCFLVEHGNMAVCGVSEKGRAHCFHPHFLLIPGKPVSLDSFVEYFGGRFERFPELIDAVNYGAERGQYVLAGDAAGPFYVFLPDGELPRQFARGLVADQLGVPELASWRDEPSIQWVLRNARRLRGILADE